jgi:hypothetical protein
VQTNFRNNRQKCLWIKKTVSTTEVMQCEKSNGMLSVFFYFKVITGMRLDIPTETRF